MDTAIRASTAAVVLAVAGIAAYISYWHAYAVVRQYGESGVTALLEPATIDGLVYASSMVILHAARHRLPVPRLARWMLALGIGASLAVNVAQGWSHGLVGAAAAAWPAVALVGSYEMLAWMIRTAAAGGPDQEPAPDHGVPGRTGHADRESQAGGPVAESTGPRGPGGPGGPAASGPAIVAALDGDVDAAAVATYRASLQEGKPLSERKLAQAFGKTSRRWARNRMAEVG
jgi:hypothetical protein